MNMSDVPCCFVNPPKVRTASVPCVESRGRIVSADCAGVVVGLQERRCTVRERFSVLQGQGDSTPIRVSGESLYHAIHTQISRCIFLKHGTVRLQATMEYVQTPSRQTSGETLQYFCDASQLFTYLYFFYSLHNYVG